METLSKHSGILQGRIRRQNEKPDSFPRSHPRFAVPLFTGCQGGTEPADNHSKNNNPVNSNSDAPQPEPDYSWFTMPEETSKLTVYSNEDNLKSVLAPAIRLFREKYPEVEVDYQIYGQDEYDSVIRTELPAGRGSDLVLLDSVTIKDVYKTMGTGLFENLDPYFAKDDVITLDDYVSGVMDGGLFRGERLVVPLAYSLPIYMTTRSLLDELGVSAESLSTCEGFTEAAKRYHEHYPDGSLYLDENYLDPLSPTMRKLYYAWNPGFIDYEKMEITAEEDQIKQYADLLKLYYIPDYKVNDKAKANRRSTLYTFQDSYLLKECLYNDGCRGFSFYMNARSLVPKEYGIFAFIPPNLNGGRTASIELMAVLPKASQNKLNAWRLLKILLSDDIQSGTDDSVGNLRYFWSGEPVKKGSIRKVLDSKRARGDYLCPTEMFDDYCALWEDVTEAVYMPIVLQEHIRDELYPYVRGERSWEDCWKRFVNTLELYKDE